MVNNGEWWFIGDSTLWLFNIAIVYIDGPFMDDRNHYLPNAKFVLITPLEGKSRPQVKN